MPSTTLRVLRDDQVEAAYEIYLQACAWLKQKGVRQWLVPKPRATFERQQQRGENYVLCHGEALVATVALGWEVHAYWREELGPKECWWLHTLAVAPDFRRRRVGEATVTAAVALLASKGSSALCLDCSADGILPAYYARLGFAAVAQKDITYPSGNTFSTVLMRRIIEPQSQVFPV